MTRKECLEQAMGCVLRDRNNEYGEPENSFDLIADLWTAYTGHVFIGSDVAAMMALLKLARLKRNARHLDSAVDLAGYAACFAECASAETARPVPFASKAEDELEFKPGDRVQYRVELPSVSDWIWRDATYLRRAFSWQQDGEHVVTDKELGPVTVKGRDIRPAPKAEGVEELVVSPFDAPQTKEELFQHIVDCNPATFHTPSYAEEQLEHHSRLQAHKPTGEELAEMAEGEAHG